MATSGSEPGLDPRLCKADRAGEREQEEHTDRPEVHGRQGGPHRATEPLAERRAVPELGLE